MSKKKRNKNSKKPTLEHVQSENKQNPVQPYMVRFTQLKNIANNGWTTRWKELSNNFDPTKGRYLISDGIDDDNRGKNNYTNIINPTPIVARRNLSSGLLGNLTSPTGKWFRLAVRDTDLMDSPEVSEYLFEVREVLLKIFSISNFYGAIHSVYEELVTFGTASMLIEEDFDTVIRCRPFTIGEYYLALGPNLEPDTLYRQFSLSARQLVEEFGYDECSTQVQANYDSNQGETLIKVIHCIQPRVQGDAAVLSDINKPFESVYFEASGKGDTNANKGFLRVTGYDEKPFMAPRWNVTAGDVYGSSQPADISLGDAKQLQTEEKLKLKQLSKETEPPLIAPSVLKNEVITQVPGEVTFADSAEPGSQGVRPLWEVRANIAPIAADIQMMESRIQRTFFNDLFQTVINETKRMTATEVAQRREEKLALLGPAVNRLQREVLENSIERTFAIAERLNLLPEVPEALAERELEIQYVSALAQAQQIVTTQSLEQVFAFAGNLSAVFPEVLDRLNADEALEGYAEDYGIDPKLVRSDEEVAEIRQARAQAQQQAQQQEAITQNAQNAKVMAETKVGESNALEAVLSGVAV